MLIISMLKAQQLGLFDSIVHVGTIVRKDGTVVAAHNRHVKKRAEEQHPQGELVLQDENKQTKLSKLDATIQKFGGQKGVANLIATAPKAVSDQIVALLAKLSKKTEDEIRTQYPAPAPKPAQPTEQPEVKEDAKPENEPEALPEKQADTPWNIVEHVTKGGKGKTIRGIIRSDLTYAEAKAIDEYTFKKDGGYFIREKHLPTMKAEARITSAVATGAITEEQAAVAKEAMQSGGIQAAAEAIADKRTIQAAKLRKGAQATIEKAQAEQNRDRLTNTHKRAREAGSAIARANKEEAIGNTMLNLADAIESGQAVHLSGVDSKAAVETLDRLISRAIYETDRKLPHQEQERNKGRAPTQTDIDNAVMPRVTAWANQIEDVADILQTKAAKGNSRLIQQIRKLANRRRDAAFELDKDDQALVLDAHKKASAVGRPYSMDYTFDQIKEVNRLNRLGITDNITLRDALSEYVQFRDGVKAEDPVKAAERALVGQKLGVDFFPTPKPLAERMADIAGIKPGMKVLEPSAGNGNLADAAKAAGADVDVLEISPQLQNVLQLKGHNLVGHDFESHAAGETYDAVIMNPPFSDRKDALHIQQAYSMLKPGGTLVAIAGEGVFFGTDKKAAAFRDWLEEQGAETEKLDAGTFQDKTLLATTGANARLITIHKPEATEHKNAVELAEDKADLAEELMRDPNGDRAKELTAKIHQAHQQAEGPKEGERNAQGLVFHDGRWHREDELAGDESHHTDDSLRSGNSSIAEYLESRGIDPDDFHVDRRLAGIEAKKRVPYFALMAEIKDDAAKLSKKTMGSVDLDAIESNKENPFSTNLLAARGMPSSLRAKYEARMREAIGDGVSDAGIRKQYNDALWAAEAEQAIQFAANRSVDANQLTSTAVDVNETANVSDKNTDSVASSVRDDANIWRLSQEEAESKYPNESSGRVRGARRKALLAAYERGEDGAAKAYDEFPEYKPTELMTPSEFIAMNPDKVRQDVEREIEKKEDEIAAVAGKLLRSVKRPDLQDKYINERNKLKADLLRMKEPAGRQELEEKVAIYRIEQAKKLMQSAVSTTNDGPQEGEVNADGLVFRGGRWHREGDDLTSALQSAGGLPTEPTDEDHDAALKRAKDAHAERLQSLRDKINSLGGAESFRFLLQSSKVNTGSTDKAFELIDRIADAVGLSRDEVMAELGIREKQAKPKSERKPRAATVKTEATPDDLDPNSPNYRYRDTGDIAGSRKEVAASMLKQAKADGTMVRSTALDWEAIEQNPREAKELITKSNLFGIVDWDGLKDGGMDAGAGYLLDRLYASVGKEPEDNAPARKDYALGIETLRDRMEKCKSVDDVLNAIKEIKDESIGVMLTSEETEQHRKLLSEFSAIREKTNELRAPQEQAYKAMMIASSAKYKAESDFANRKKRGWAIKPEHEKELEDARRAHVAAEKAWSKALADAKPFIEAMELAGRANRDKRVAIDSAARLRSENNPVRKVWASLGDKFQNAVNYRGAKGSQAFANHVATVKAGRVTNWDWASKEPKAVSKPKEVTTEQAKFQLRVSDSHKRIGGRNVSVTSTKALKEQFGLREVQSGNWVLKDPVSAKFHVEQSAAAMADLADLIGVPDNVVSMNGRLAIAFGARGTGNAGGMTFRAHYEPVQRVMNMTKMGGGGCLGHEWFHAFDNMIREMATDTATPSMYYASAGSGQLPDGELKDAYADLHKAMTEGDERQMRQVPYTAHDHRTAKYNIDRMHPNTPCRIIKAAGNASDASLAIEQHFGDRVKRGDKSAIKNMRQWLTLAAAYYGKPEGGSAEVATGEGVSAFKKAAIELEGGRKKAYWSQSEEMAARAFQAWIEDRLSDKGAQNDYLSSMADNRYYDEGRPFPEGEERKRINAAFDRLFEVVRKENLMHKALGLM